jgi:putative transposase
MRASVGRTGVCWDNALAESFFAALKNELVHRTALPTRNHARKAIARYIEVFYNRRRLHSGLGYRTPLEVHTEYLNRQLAA